MDPALCPRHGAVIRIAEKGVKIQVERRAYESVRKMKEALAATPALRKAVYGKDTPIYVMVDTSPTEIRWVVNQEDEDGMRFQIRFGAKVLSEGQRGYAQVKRELWGIILAVKNQ